MSILASALGGGRGGAGEGNKGGPYFDFHRAVDGRSPDICGELKRVQALLSERGSGISTYGSARAGIVKSYPRGIIVYDRDLSAGKSHVRRDEYHNGEQEYE